jgi:hypothetical protein
VPGVKKLFYRVIATSNVSPLTGLLVFLGLRSRRFPFTSFRARAVGYGISSLRDFRRIGPRNQGSLF